MRAKALGSSYSVGLTGTTRPPELSSGLVVARGWLSIGVIAERMGIEVPTVVRTVRRLEAAGFVSRESDTRRTDATS
jgi:DNA-binding MarR family transcriptional regulator